MQNDLKEFVTGYIRLREVEKKALKESGLPFQSLQLRQTVIGIMTRYSTDDGSTERYTGGAKERARQNVDNGTATRADMAVLEGHMCAWCGGDLSSASRFRGVESTYCSRECAEEGRLKRGGMYASTQVRAQVFALEGGVCQLCGIDGHALYTRVCSLQPAERLNALCNVNWKLPKTPKAVERLLQDPKEGDFWQADHIRAVAEGGGGSGLDNLRTLCVPCHAGETERLRKRLRLTGGPSSQRDDPAPGDEKTRQTDIRSMFLPASKAQLAGDQNPRRKS
jgi:5-methylcytosine-specific restriction endonuclease McrA